MKRKPPNSNFEFKAALTGLVLLLLTIGGAIAVHVVNHQLGKPIPDETIRFIRAGALSLIFVTFLLSLMFAASGIAKE